MREEPFEVHVGGGSLVGCAAADGAPALLLHGGPAISDYMGSCADTNASMAEHFERGTLERKLPEVALPVLIVHGVQSPLPIESLQHTAALIPGSVFESVQGSGHFPWLEQPGAVRRAAERFL